MSEQPPQRSNRKQKPKQTKGANNSTATALQLQSTPSSQQQQHGKKNKNRQKKSSSGEQQNNGSRRRNHGNDEGKNRRQNGSQNPQKQQHQSRHAKNGSSHNNNVQYPAHESYEECLQRYTSQISETPATQTSLPPLIRGTLRVLPGNDDLPGFVVCDRGLYTSDVLLANALARNRALHGDTVFCEVQGPVVAAGGGSEEEEDNAPTTSAAATATVVRDEEAGDEIVVTSEQLETLHLTDREEIGTTWQDDAVQMSLWNPQVSIPKPTKKRGNNKQSKQPQYQGRVVCIEPPRRRQLCGSEITGDGAGEEDDVSHLEKSIVGSLKILGSGTVLLTPLNKALPQFRCPPRFADSVARKEELNQKEDEAKTKDDAERVLYKATYTYGDWQETHKWPPCQNLEKIGDACLLEDEIAALLLQNGVNHGAQHPPDVLQNVQEAVQSGLYHDAETGAMGWKPTPSMYQGRRDYRKQRIFTIDPTTAKDLDDALHVTFLPELQQVEIGVHIADVSYFCHPNSPVDREALRRATTVYLVDRVLPMLPRPLCEVACSLNENVERLAFSCVWRMNLDGTLPNDGDAVWYGRSVIRSCARLDYATAQNIIDGKEAEWDDGCSEAVWPRSRRPTGGHTMDQVAQDVLLLHKVAMARRQLRFDNGALALNGVKMTFQLDPTDGQTPLLAAPYPIRDSNRLVEEYMLLANYLVAQRLLEHAKGRALIRHHPEPSEDGLDKVADVAKAAIGFDIDISTSQTLHESLRRLRQECEDPLVLQAVTEMLMAPMVPADYLAAGTIDSEQWKHFALNIPYYTHFTSPIRRYPDIIVHRLLQATIDETAHDFPLSITDIQRLCVHCNQKRLGSKYAQDRCDRVFLSLYLRAHPMHGEMGVVLSTGVSSFTVFVPSIGASGLLYLDEHKDVLTFECPDPDARGGRTITLHNSGRDGDWQTLDIRIFVKVKVTVYCRDKPPIDIKFRLEGPWAE